MTQADKTDPRTWANALFGKAELGDQRRTNRLVKIAGDLAEHLGCSTAKACGKTHANLEGAYRFIRNESICAEDILETGLQMNAQVVQDSPGDDEYLAIQDSTVLSFKHSVREELGDVGGPISSTARGWIIHSTLMWNLGKEAFVGLGDQAWILRPEEERGKKHQRAKRAYEDKESYKWEAAHNRLTKRLGIETMNRVVMVGDSEADIYRLLSYFQRLAGRYVIRASHNRAVDPSQEQVSLWQQLQQVVPLGTRKVQIQQRQGRKARTAQVVLRTRTVKLRRPETIKAKQASQYLEVNVVYANEENPPQGEERLEWMIVTSENNRSVEEVNQIVDKYEKRWQIEEYHKAWKSGTKVEELRQQRAENLKKIAILLGFVAVRLLWLKMQMEKEPQRDCTEVLRQDEWKVLWMSTDKRPLPQQPPSVQWAYRAIAKLAHWTDTKRTGRASWDTLWQGWHLLAQRLLLDASFAKVSYRHILRE
jgi:hypothetical protein